MAKRRKAEEKWQAKVGTSSFNPLEIMDLQDAVKLRKKKIKLGEREFILEYREDGKVVYYHPSDGFAPAGYIEIRRLMED